MKTNIGIADKNSKAVATLLNKFLADEFVLYTKTRIAHWNIEGDNFIELHKLFESQYEQLDDLIDDTAERIRSIGHYAVGSLSDFLKLTHLTEEKISSGKQNEIIAALLNDHETIVRLMRNAITETAEKYKDLGTSDFITGKMEAHEKMAWMLRAYLA